MLTIDDIRNIFASEHCNPANAEGYRNRLIFGVGLAIGARPTELCMMKVSQFKREEVNGKAGLVYYPKIDSELGESKNAKGGVHAIKYYVRNIPINDIPFSTVR